MAGNCAPWHSASYSVLKSGTQASLLIHLILHLSWLLRTHVWHNLDIGLTAPRRRQDPQRGPLSVAHMLPPELQPVMEGLYIRPEPAVIGVLQ